ncbi:ABC transporter ATP-binding protein (plasmid) [Aneurinibacillus sp. Ricciae_BoGa-3]|uniref:ABC transporter ATP-binding protein n=1 Tax=Aneurinibacillus sp. Ricciae_BoGa-3 TaxID=3022697 RepID=UPI0023406AB7|nr:ABC transporter ATP-binding protein [Aneurinibacillus sp. Ricciae_BoGa-3]WCK57030.1 ABC transporter ATP-binding protein [Aneurinibacillus sp. Ricciae_BoGa-3]
MLEIENLTKKYNDFTLDNISFRIEEGDVVGFVGQNGAGKSTTMKLILNMIKKDSGKIQVFGLDHIKEEEKIKDRIGFVFDGNYFYEELSVGESSDFFSSFYSKWDTDMLHHYLRTFGISKKKKIKQLSKGMKMKFALAVALSHDADLFLMDEATSGLDPFAREELLDILLQINQTKKKTFLFSSHIISDIEKIANKIIFIHNGTIIMNGTKQAIKSQFISVKGRLETFPEQLVKQAVGYRKWASDFVMIATQEYAPIFEKMGYRVEPATLEDIILFHIKRKNDEKTFEII